MTQKEQQTIDSLLNAIQDLRIENREYKEYINKQVEAINGKVDQKQMPITLEQQVLQSVDKALSKGLTDVLTAYDSPIRKYATKALEPYESQIIGIFSKSIEQSITSGEITNIAKNELIHKIVRTVIRGIDGSVDKVVNQMKQDSIFRSKLTLFVNQLIEEFIIK